MSRPATRMSSQRHNGCELVLGIPLDSDTANDPRGGPVSAILPGSTSTKLECPPRSFHEAAGSQLDDNAHWETTVIPFIVRSQCPCFASHKSPGGPKGSKRIMQVVRGIMEPAKFIAKSLYCAGPFPFD